MRGCGFAVVDGLVPGFATVTVRNSVSGEVWLPEWMSQTNRTPIVAGAVTHATFVKAP